MIQYASSTVLRTIGIHNVDTLLLVERVFLSSSVCES